MSFGNGLSFEQMKRDLPGDLAALRREWGDAFLLVDTVDIESSSEKTQVATLSGMRPKSTTDENTAMRGVVVYIVRRKAESPFDWISIGRNEGNDIWLPHASVSRFHALLREAVGDAALGGGGVAVHDAKSANGTHVGNDRALRAGDGPPIMLRSGMTVRFGDITARFLDSAALHAMLTK